MEDNEKRTYCAIKSDKILNGILKNIINKPKYSFLFSVNRNWEYIIGKKYFKYTKVEKVSFLNENKNANLYITTYNSSVSFFINNNKNYILDKINNLFGYKAVINIFIKEVPKIIQEVEAKEEKYIVDEEKLNNFIKNNNTKDEKLRSSLNKLAECYFKEITF